MNHIRKLTMLFAIVCASTAHASQYSSTNVKSLKLKPKGHYVVRCVDKTKGRIFEEEETRCAFSKKNQKNRCELSAFWPREDAAEYLCDGTPDIDGFDGAIE